MAEVHCNHDSIAGSIVPASETYDVLMCKVVAKKLDVVAAQRR